MTTKQPKPRSEREPRRDDHDRLSADIKDLYRACGHYGPWSSDERVAAFGIVEVERTPLPDRPQDLKNLAAVMDLMVVAFDEADKAWSQVMSQLRAETSGPLMVSADYGRIIERGSGTQLRELERARKDKLRTREEAGEELRAAKVAFYAAEKAWLLSLKAAEAAN